MTPGPHVCGEFAAAIVGWGWVCSNSASSTPSPCPGWAHMCAASSLLLLWARDGHAVTPLVAYHPLAPEGSACAWQVCCCYCRPGMGTQQLCLDGGWVCIWQVGRGCCEWDGRGLHHPHFKGGTTGTDTFHLPQCQMPKGWCGVCVAGKMGTSNGGPPCHCGDWHCQCICCSHGAGKGAG